MSDLHVWPSVSWSADRMLLFIMDPTPTLILFRNKKKKSHATWLVLSRHAGVFIYSRKKAGTETVVCQQLSDFFSDFTWNGVGVKNALLLSHNKMQKITYHAELASRHKRRKLKQSMWTCSLNKYRLELGFLFIVFGYWTLLGMLWIRFYS